MKIISVIDVQTIPFDIRDGKSQTIDATQVVPSDVIALSAGNLVPADVVLLEARDFLVSQAALTGESFPVEKFTGVTRADASLPQRTNAIFLGTSVRSGTARMLVVQTGAATEFGAIAGRLATEEETDFAKGIRKFG